MEQIQTYMTEPCSIPFCKGCGHGHVLRKLNDALVQLQIEPRSVCLVTDIGCIGLADSLFALPHTVHTTHGRSTAFATGIELADGVLADSRLKTIVLIGDGGAMIGLLHLVNAALLNADVTVILCNNYLFGMTGGQNSAFSPLDFITATTPKGNMIPPLDICRLMIDSSAGYVARKLATDQDLAGAMAEAISFPGFSLLEVVELCTEFGAKRNQLSGNILARIVENHGQELGVLSNKTGRDEFASMYGGKFPADGGPAAEEEDGFILRKYENSLGRRIGITLAGSAGERVQSSGSAFCAAAVQAGLFTTQKNDNPVTQGSGFSISEICVDPGDISYTGIEVPDALVLVSDDGIRELVSRGVFERCTSSTTIVCDAGLTLPETTARILRLPLRKTFTGRRAALGALAVLLASLDIFPLESFIDAVSSRDPDTGAFIGEKTRLLINQ